jgi:hypothetical protein
MAMTNEAEQLLAEVTRRVKLDESFCPVEIGAAIDLPKPKAEAAARVLANAGILVLGFDSAAEFTPDYRKARAKAAAAAAPAKGRRKK